LEEQGHSPYTWAVLGAVSQVTERMGLMSFVTCPTRRYHPAVVAQKAATVALLSEGRFTLGLGAGENLNEHVVGDWPHLTQRQDMLVEALEIIRPLLAGETVSYDGLHYTVPEARLYDRPEEGVPVAVAMSGRSSAEIAAEHADAMIATQPQARLIELYEQAGGADRPRYGQVPICYGPDEDACKKLVHEQFRWTGFGWHVLAELPNTKAFAQATESVSADEVAKTVPCGPDLDRHVAAVRKYLDAGFTHVALVQVGAEGQQRFTEWARSELLPALRAG
jgi:G6PDH family F420-dependent oxidoreductase